MTSSEAPSDHLSERRALRRGAFLTSGAGIAFGILAVVSWILLDDARQGLVDGGDPRELYGSGATSGSEIAALYLLPFAAILFLWFIVALRAWIRGTQRRRNLLISDVQLVSGTVFAVLFLVGAGALATAVIVAQADPGTLTPESLRVLNAFGSTVMQVMAVRIAAIFVIASASLGMTTGALPRWFNLVSFVFAAVLMLAPILSSVLVMAFPIWVVAVSVLLLYHVFTLPDDELPGFARRMAPQSSPAGASGDDVSASGS